MIKNFCFKIVLEKESELEIFKKDRIISYANNSGPVFLWEWEKGTDPYLECYFLILTDSICFTNAKVVSKPTNNNIPLVDKDLFPSICDAFDWANCNEKLLIELINYIKKHAIYDLFYSALQEFKPSLEGGNRRIGFK